MKAQSPKDAMEVAARTMSEVELEAVASRLMRLAVKDAMDTYKHGTPDMKAALTRTFITAMSKQLEAKDSDEGLADMRQQFQDLIGLTDGDN